LEESIIAAKAMNKRTLNYNQNNNDTTTTTMVGSPIGDIVAKAMNQSGYTMTTTTTMTTAITTTTTLA